MLGRIVQDDGKDASKTRTKSNKWSLCGVTISLSVHSLLDGSHEFIVGLVCGEVRVVSLDIVRALEQEACLACTDHSEIVVAVAACDGLETNGLERLNCCQLGLDRKSVV